MAEHGILFSPPMVRALLAGTKTQTRRLLSEARVFATPETKAFTLRGDDLARALQNASGFRRLDGNGWFWESDAFEWQAPALRTGWMAHIGYAPGDRLWVKESSADVHPLAVQDERFSLEGEAGIPGPPPVKYRRVFRADGDVRQVWHTSSGYPYRSVSGPEDEIAAKHPEVCSEWVGRLKYQAWTPSIYMPRWASRLTLIVTDVRVQRLQDIGRDDAMAEGIVQTWGDFMGDPPEWAVASINRHGDASGSHIYDNRTSVENYRELWNHINGTGSWDANPWVVAYTFEVHRQNIDAMEKAA